LQCVAVCCSVLQCVAVCCSVLQCVAMCCSVLQCVAVCFTVTVCCTVLPYFAFNSLSETINHHYKRDLQKRPMYECFFESRFYKKD